MCTVLSTVPNQKPPLLEPKPAKTRPKNFYQKKHHNFRPNRHNFRNFEVEKLNFLQIPLMFTEKCENLAFFYPPLKIFPATQMSQTATFPPTRHNWQHWFCFACSQGTRSSAAANAVCFCLCNNKPRFFRLFYLKIINKNFFNWLYCDKELLLGMLENPGNSFLKTLLPLY